MNSTKFREEHLLRLLDAYDPERGPFDRFLAKYFKENRALGSKDRRFVAGQAYELLRWQGLLDGIGADEWPERWQLLRDHGIESLRSQAAGHIAVSLPEALYTRLVEAYGEEKANDLGLALNQEAPITLRANPLKCSRSELLERLAAYEPHACTQAQFGIRLGKREALFQLQEFRDGFFEMQDEASQIVAQMVAAQGGDQVLDYCAGSGGKSLGFAHQMQGRGQIYLHDVRQAVLLEARRRLKRAGVQNAQILSHERSSERRWKQSMDWVLVDAPCTGTGTYRRNPDMKWRYSDAMLSELIGLQRTVFERALRFLKPGGRIVYATCSILREENQQQLDFFRRTHELELCGEAFQSFPVPGEMDGFYGVVLKRRSVL